MCAPIPKGKWSWKYESCIKCGTKKIRHKGRGLCVRCFDKKRAENPKRKEQLRNQHLKWWEKVKGTAEHKKYASEKAAVWQKKQPIKHRRNWQTCNLRKSFKKFILSTARNKTKKGLEILINGRKVKTNIKPPKKCLINHEKDDTIRKIEIFREVYEKTNPEK